MEIQQIQKRSQVVYGRVKPVNKEWLEKEAARHKISEAEFLDDLLDIARNTDARHKERAKKRPSKARKGA